MRKRILYSQNFLKDKDLVERIVRLSSIGKDDTVYEIGVGQGIITQELIRKSGKVIAFEIDQNLFNKLSTKFKDEQGLELKQSDFLTHALPHQPYKVFSNIPFNITAAVIKKITDLQNPSDDSYLIVQREAAQKFVGKPFDSKNSQVSVLLKAWFELNVIYKFQRDDFFPRPSVDTVLLNIKRREVPLIESGNKTLYEDFVVYTFNQFKPTIMEGLKGVFDNLTLNSVGFSLKLKPSELKFENWIKLFNLFLQKGYQEIVKGSHSKQSSQQQTLEKVHRTRMDRDWKQYKK